MLLRTRGVTLAIVGGSILWLGAARYGVGIGGLATILYLGAGLAAATTGLVETLFVLAVAVGTVALGWYLLRQIAAEASVWVSPGLDSGFGAGREPNTTTPLTLVYTKPVTSLTSRCAYSVDASAAGSDRWGRYRGGGGRSSTRRFRGARRG